MEACEAVTSWDVLSCQGGIFSLHLSPSTQDCIQFSDELLEPFHMTNFDPLGKVANHSATIL